MRNRICVVAAVAAAAGGLAVPGLAQPCEPGWLPEFAPNGVGNEGSLSGAIGVDVHYTGGPDRPPTIYLAGFFDTAGGLPAGSFARWDGRSWSSMNSNFGHEARAVAVYDDGLGNGPTVYVGGTFSGGNPLPGLARWNGSAWVAVPNRPSSVNDMVVFDDGGGDGPALYCGDLGVVRWTPQGSVGLSGPGHPGRVFRLAVLDPDGPGPAPASLYAAGTRSTGGSVIARWDGQAWNQIGTWSAGEVRAMAYFDPDGPGPMPPQLYVGGLFSQAGSTPATNLARWDGAEWHAVGAGANRIVRAMHVADLGDGPRLYIGGDFSTVNGMTARNVVAFDGETFSPLGYGVEGGSPSGYGVVHNFASYHDGERNVLLVVGRFDRAGQFYTPGAAVWTGSAWRGLGASPPGVGPRTIGVDPAGRLLAASARGPHLAGQVLAAWNGRTWETQEWFTNGGASVLRTVDLGDGLGPTLYAAGTFTGVGGTPAQRIARRTDVGWEDVGGGLLGGTRAGALAVYTPPAGGGPLLVAAGNFTSAGGAPVAGIAAWNGASWLAIGPELPGASNPYRALAVFDDGSGPALYAAGTFSHADDVQVNSIIRWDGSSWSPVGEGFRLPDGQPGTVYALHVHSDRVSPPALYAAGAFSFSGETPVRNIARWNGVTWESVGEGILGSAVALASLDEDGTGPGLPVLLAAGGYSVEGSAQVTAILRWSGGAWTLAAAPPASSGLSTMVSGLAGFELPLGNHALVVAGLFSRVGSHAVEGLALYGGCPRCPADYNNDGSVNSTDLSAFIQGWLSALANEPVDADFNRDGAVNSSDLSAFISAWLAAVQGGC